MALQQPHTGCRQIALTGWAAMVLACATTALAVDGPGTPRTIVDVLGDAVVRRTDPGADGPIDPQAHALPDLISHAIGAWRPSDPQADLFAGEWDTGSDFFRLDLDFAGLINPPGTLGTDGPFEPFKYGPNPVFGYVEIDMDDETDTGGELAMPQLRYLGQTARFGGLPSVRRYATRSAHDAGAFDNQLSTPPFVDRSGEEFHLALSGSHIDSIWRSDEGDMIFGVGERWVLTGRLFHRAHGYEKFSFACCQAPPGSYLPQVRLQFIHDPSTDRTTVSLVCPLNNEGSAAERGDLGPEPLDGNTANQTSVLEALDDLVFSVINAPPGWANHPYYPIISKWLEQNPAQYLDPLEWKATAVFGTSYTDRDSGALYVWTDINPEVVRGDFDGNGISDQADLVAFDAYIAAGDGSDNDDDGTTNGRVQIMDFGANFSLFDLDYDGVVDGNDRQILLGVMPARGDFDMDGDVDQKDFAHLQSCRGVVIAVPGDACSEADLDHDGVVGAGDVLLFEACHSGPDVPADAACAGVP